MINPVTTILCYVFFQFLAKTEKNLAKQLFRVEEKETRLIFLLCKLGHRSEICKTITVIY
jgi:hypothetical protein